MSVNPYESPDTAGQSPQRKPGRLQFRLIDLLAVVGIIGILIGLLLPAVRTAREPARRTQCSNNLRQIALALQNYEAEYHALPPAHTVDAQGKPLHSWRTLILPYLEQQALYDTIDLSKPWNDPANKVAYDTKIWTYRCPSAVGLPTHTTYLAVVGHGCCFRPTEPRKLAEITDDHDATLMVVEVDVKQAVHWMSPADATEQMVLSFGSAGSLAHSGGAQAACVSGRIVFLTDNTKTETLRALISIAGNDDAVAQAAD